MRRVRALGAGLCVVAMGLLAGWVPGAAAAPGAVSGWWQQANQAPGPIPATAPADPSTPPDGIQVSSTAAGVVAIGAVRIAPPTAGVDSVLTLRLASGTATSPSADLAVHACPATNKWKPVQNGPWANRATFNETACITGRPASDQKSVSFAIPAAAQRGGNVDVAIEALSSAPVTLAFSHPVPSDLVVTAPDVVTPPVETPPAVAPDAASSAAPTSAPDQAPVATPDASQSIGPGLAAPATTPVAAPAAPARPVAPAASPRQVLTPVAVSAPALSDKRSTRIVAVLLLLGIGVALFWFGGQPVRSPHMVGNLGGRMGSAVVVAGPAHEVRGVGRFARPREPGRRPGR